MTLHQLNNSRGYYISYKGIYFIFSYNTHIATLKDGRVYKHWHDWSATSMIHLNGILRELGYTFYFTKAEWLELDYTPFERLLNHGE